MYSILSNVWLIMLTTQNRPMLRPQRIGISPFIFSVVMPPCLADSLPICHNAWIHSGFHSFIAMQRPDRPLVAMIATSAVAEVATGAVAWILHVFVLHCLGKADWPAQLDVTKTFDGINHWSLRPSWLSGSIDVDNFTTLGRRRCYFTLFVARSVKDRRPDPWWYLFHLDPT